MIKDVQTLKECSFLIGDSPLEPKSLDNIVIIGDCAINSTNDRDFRTIQIIKEARTEDEYQRVLVNYKALNREKLLEWESQKELIKENLKDSFKDDELKLKKALKSLENEGNSLRNKLEEKNKSFVKKQKKKRKKEMDKSKIIKFKNNKKILEIPGCPPNLYDYLDLFIKFYGKKWVPTLDTINKSMNVYYNRKKITKSHKSFAKERKLYFKERSKQ